MGKSGGSYAAATEVTSKRDFGSSNPRRACDLLKDLFLIPVSLLETRFTAINRCRGPRNRAFTGVSESRKKITKDHTQVAPPSFL